MMPVVSGVTLSGKDTQGIISNTYSYERSHPCQIY